MASSEAQALLESGEELTAPALVRIEVFAAITRKVRLREILPDEARAACALWSRALSSGALALVKDDEILSAAVDLALAQREQALLVTADPKFRLRAQPLYPSLQLLAD